MKSQVYGCKLAHCLTCLLLPAKYHILDAMDSIARPEEAIMNRSGHSKSHNVCTHMYNCKRFGYIDAIEDFKHDLQNNGDGIL